MFLRFKSLRDNRESGFTLIELLVVILIIGILAAIAIPMFLNQRKAAVDAAVKSDVSNAAKQIETAAIKAGSGGAAVTIATKTGNTQVITVGAGNTITTTVSDGTELAVTGNTGTGYTVTGTNTGGDKSTTANGGIVYNSASGGLQ